jgi:hypothetical protein
MGEERRADLRGEAFGHGLAKVDSTKLGSEAACERAKHPLI